MTRLSRRIRNNIYDYIDEERMYYEDEKEQDNQYQREYQYEQQIPRELLQKEHNYDEQESAFGESRDPTAFAKEIEKDQTPPGLGVIRIGGRPIDLHMLEDYMVWKISPYQLRTVLRYRNARVMEEIKNYSSLPVMRIKGSSILWILLAVGLGIVGFIIVTMMPQLTDFFKSFV